MKKKRIAKEKTIQVGRPNADNRLRTYLPGVRVLQPQYKKIIALTKKNKTSISATVRGLLDAAL